MPDVKAFRPINEAHAIVEASIFFEFQPSFQKAAVEEISEIQFQLKSDFPIAQPLNAIEIIAKTDGEDIKYSQEIVGIELIKPSLTQPSLHEWVLRTASNHVSVHCLNYIRWADFWNKSASYLRTVFKKFDHNKYKATGIALKVVDRFIYEGDLASYSADALFNKGTRFIFPHVFSSNEYRWHSHTGWFEHYDDRFEILNQLNINSALIDQAGGAQHHTTIEHNVILKPKISQLEAVIPLPLNEGEEADVKLNAILLKMHEINKKVIHDLLISEMKDIIKLKV